MQLGISKYSISNIIIYGWPQALPLSDSHQALEVEAAGSPATFAGQGVMKHSSREAGSLPESALTRREAVRRFAWLMAAPLIAGLPACVSGEPLVRIATNVWPGYEFLYLARARGYYDAQPLRLLEMASTGACLDLLAAGTAEGAALTLDEVLRAQAQGLDLRVIAVLNISIGADVVMARPDIRALGDLAGRRVGVERGAVGAIMLDAVLQEAGLGINDVIVVETANDAQLDAYQRGQLDALVSYEPVATRLAALGATRLFDSRQIPGRILDVLAMRPGALEQSPAAIRSLLRGHFRAHAEFQVDPATHEVLARRLGGPADAVPSLYAGIDMPDAARNRALFAQETGKLPELTASAQALAKVMQRAGLLQATPDLGRLFDAGFLPGERA